MSLAAPYQEHYYVADGETTRFSFGEYFSAPTSANVKCIIYFEDGTSCVPSFNVDITTGYIDIIALTTPDGQVLNAPPAGSSVRVFRDTPEQQNVTASQLQNYTAKQLEKIFDSIVAMIQENTYTTEHKTVRLTETQRDVFLEVLTELVDGSLLYWDNTTRTIKPTDFPNVDVVQCVGGLFFRVATRQDYNYLQWSTNKVDWHSIDLGSIEALIDELIARVEEAERIAGNAKDVADEAKDIAQDAKDIADAFDERLTQAEQDASDAKDIANATADSLADHIADKDNPHEVTKAQVGLGNVDNTADLDKPVIIKSATIPTASADLVGKEYQYFGATNGTYTHGFVYECVAETETDDLILFNPVGTGKLGFDYTHHSVYELFERIAAIEGGFTAQDVVSGSFTLDKTNELWYINGYDSNGDALFTNFTVSGTGDEYSLDAFGFVYTFQFPDDYEDGHEEAFSIVQDSHSTYSWERVDVQPGVEVIDNVTSTSTTAALSANQGKVLNDRIDDVSGRGRFLALWNCATGLAESNPPESPYTYKAGDYFVVGTVSSATPAVNYKPDGSSYTTGVASTTVETNEVSVNDTYFYDGTVWKLQSNAQKEVSFSALAGSPYDNTNLASALNSKADASDLTSHVNNTSNPHSVTAAQVGLGNVDNTSDLNKPISTATQTALNGKQDTLTAGTNITITNNVISSTAQETFFRGRWNNWTSVPTDASLYPTDIHNNRKPLSNDFMVVTDASGYQGGYDNVVNITWKNEMLYGMLNITNITFIDVTSGTTSTLSRTDYRSEVRTQVGNIYVRLGYGYNPTIYFYSDSDYSIPIQVEYNGNLVTSITYTGTEELEFTIKYAYSDTSYEGSWRFYYDSGYSWDADGKTGWKPQYQVEETLPDATDQEKGIAKLYTDLGQNTDGAVDQATVTSALGEKQDTLTAGTNIIIENNVISSKAQETFFRGRWNSWNSVPTDASLYPADIHNNHKPLMNDFMVVTDASGYSDDFPIDVSILFYSGGWDDYFYCTMGGETKDIRGVGTYTFSNGVVITKLYNQWSSAVIKINRKFKVGDSIIEKDTSYNLMYNITSMKIASENPTVYDGSWRFYYDSNYSWDADGKTGWKPQYQVEETLPDATDQEKGIAKLYTTTGNNTDGSIDQATITTLLSSKADSANLATVATSGSYTDLSDKPTIPTVNNSTITITQGGVTKGSFTLNQASGDTIALDAGGGSSYTAGDGIDITSDVISVSDLDCGTM